MIDAGYQWRRAWGRNPIDALCNVVAEQAHWQAPGGGWVPQPADFEDADGDGCLDAIAGHANFVAGVIGQYSAWPTIRS